MVPTISESEEGRGVRGAGCTSRSGAGSDPGAVPTASAAHGRARGDSSGRSATGRCSGGAQVASVAAAATGHNAREASREGNGGAGSDPGALSAGAAALGLGCSSGSGGGASRRCGGGSTALGERGAGPLEGCDVNGTSCKSSNGAESVPGVSPAAGATHGTRDGSRGGKGVVASRSRGSK